MVTTHNRLPQSCCYLIVKNSDASVVAGNEVICVGVVFRDHLGTVLAALAKWVWGSFDVKTTELLAIREAWSMQRSARSRCSLWSAIPYRLCKDWARLLAHLIILSFILILNIYLITLSVIRVTLFLVMGIRWPTC